jgi:hypothetical protein
LICNRDCFNCTFSDCIYDGITEEERKDGDKRDLVATSALEDVGDVIRTGKVGRPRKVVLKRQTESGKIEKRERMKNYYERCRDERISYQKKYNEQNKERKREYDRQRYLRRKAEKECAFT